MGNPYLLQLDYYSGSGDFNVIVQVDQGFGYLPFAGLNAIPWDGSTPVTIGPLPWDDYGGAPSGTFTVELPYPP